MLKRPVSLILLLSSYLLFIVGKTIQNLCTTVLLESHGIPALAVGMVASAFYAGFILGALTIGHIINQLGQYHSFIWLTIACAMTAWLQCYYVSAIYWGILILCSGATSAGLLVILENHLIQSSSIAFRGRMLSVYMLIAYLAQATSQHILQSSITSPTYFFQISGGLMLLSLLPFIASQTRFSAYTHQAILSLTELWQRVPIGISTCFISGIFQGTIGLMLPAFLHNQGFNYTQIADTMFMTILGSTVLQYPIGCLADWHEEKRLLVWIAISIGLTSILLNHYTVLHNMLYCFVYGFFLGGLTFSIYPIGINIATMRQPHDKQLTLVQSALVSYSIGAAIGPTSLSFVQYFSPHMALAWHFCIAATILAIIPIILNKSQQTSVATLGHI